MPTSPEETEPLNPPPSYDPSPFYSELSRDPRAPLYLFILHGISFVLSVIGLAFAFWGWYIARTAPFDPLGKQKEIDSYERNFLGMMSIYSLLGSNILWEGMNLYFLREGTWKYNDISDFNTGYDLLVGTALMASGVLNMVTVLSDRRLCDGWRGEDQEVYDRCDDAQSKLLTAEMVALSLGLLVAAVHLILPIARYYSKGQMSNETRSRWLRLREERDVLSNLTDRRLPLERDTQHGGNLSLLPVEPAAVEDLIDVGEPRPRPVT